MNKLPLQTRVQILNLLCEGSSMRAISRVTGVSINTVTKLLIDAGLACARFHDEKVRGVKARRIQCDEIWSFCYAKAKNVATAKAAPEGAGNVWTWTALDSDSKMIVSYLVGGRDGEYAMAFMDDLRGRLANRVQLTTDGHKAYLNAVEEAFGDDIDYGMLVKIYGEGPKTEARYSPAICTGARKEAITGNPDKKHVSTSHVERSNLSMRMHMRRFTRLTNGHSKKFEHHCHMVALYTVWYNFARINSAVKVAPAMAAGVSSKLWEMSDIIALIDAREEAPKRPATYRKRGDEISN
ncbi:MAG TPA: IS1 family transposase [Stellaceae bacterium]|jgi:IS1 family transposase|nr:IS1 family transposase [Stellaceae bacterium]